MNLKTEISKKTRFNLELVIMGFMFLILFIMPVIFTRVDGEISWRHVFKIWLDQSLLIPLFVLNHWVFVPVFLHKKKTISYFVAVLALISLLSFGYMNLEKEMFVSHSNVEKQDPKRPEKVPPYAQLLMYSLLIVGVDTGLLLSKKWYETEEKRHLLEVKNAEIQLEALRNQVSPHFFMNTLNNIYALIDCDTPKAKEAVIKLSKLMRYMLYENEHGRVKISKEFEFIRSYIDLMRLRYADELSVSLIFPEELNEMLIPPMLFICYVENAFKHGVSYQQESYIHVVFEKLDDRLRFSCSNSRLPEGNGKKAGGLGLKNNENRLKLLFADAYKLNYELSGKTFNVVLEIPFL